VAGITTHEPLAVLPSKRAEGMRHTSGPRPGGAGSAVRALAAECQKMSRWISRVPWHGQVQETSRPGPDSLFPAAALLLALVYAFGWRVSRGDRQRQLCGASPVVPWVHLALHLVVLYMTERARYLPGSFVMPRSV
jgi:hypothetical protein